MGKPSKSAIKLLRRVLDAEEKGYDGYGAHGAAEYAMMRVLSRAAFVEYTSDGVCSDCDSAAHQRNPTDVPLWTITPAGRLRLELADGSRRLCEGSGGECGSASSAEVLCEDCEAIEREPYVVDAVASALAADRARIAAAIRLELTAFDRDVQDLRSVRDRVLRAVENK